MNDKQRTKASKFLSLVLRHEPQTIGITLDEAGWVPVATLLAACATHRFPISLDDLKEVVATSDKKRFAFNDDGSLIRANQGHSVPVELGYSPAQPPEVLYHGAPQQFVASILEQGLLKQQRHHVHLSADAETAMNVGQRRGKPVILKVLAAKMHTDGHIFYLSANGVWLTEHVPPQYLMLEKSS